jgi:hypothetical protein
VRRGKAKPEWIEARREGCSGPQMGAIGGQVVAREKFISRHPVTPRHQSTRVEYEFSMQNRYSTLVTCCMEIQVKPISDEKLVARFPIQRETDRSE